MLSMNIQALMSAVQGDTSNICNNGLKKTNLSTITVEDFTLISFAEIEV